MSMRTPSNQSWHLRLVSLVERLVRLEPQRAGEGRTRERSRRKSIHALESRCAMIPARAAFKQIPQGRGGPRDEDGRGSREPGQEEACLRKAADR